MRCIQAPVSVFVSFRIIDVCILSMRTDHVSAICTSLYIVKKNRMT